MDFSKLMKQAQQMQERISEIQDKLAKTDIEGIAGGGLVSVVLSGKGEMKKISLNLDVKEETNSVLEDLIMSAHNDAWKKMEKKREEEFGGAAVGIPPELGM